MRRLLMDEEETWSGHVRDGTITTDRKFSTTIVIDTWILATIRQR